MSKAILLSDDEEEKAGSSPVHISKKQRRFEPDPAVVVLLDDPIPKKPGTTSTPSFIPDTPIRVSDSQNKFSGISGLIWLDSDDESGCDYGREKCKDNKTRATHFDAIDSSNTFLALCDDEVFSISDEKYAQELQLQEALISSAIDSIVKSESLVEEEHPSPTKISNAKAKQTGESSQSFCGICMDVKPTREMLRNNSCTHLFCADCIGKYIAVRIQENISVVKCPDPECSGLLEPQFCCSIIPLEVYDRWNDALCESLILASEKFYCPFKDCSAMLVDDGGEVVTESECPNCRRLFCAQCKVSWHAGIECREFQKLNKDERGTEDIILMNIAKSNKWKRCPHCKFYVERIDGCLHIACRCGFHFCYACGSKYTSSHACSQY